MMSNYGLSEISLSKLTCFICKKPLSLFPIYYSNGDPSCGRCARPQNSYRCEIFEEIAKNVEFPCCNKQNGCLDILLPKDVANHELHCKFQKFTCPFNCFNEWKDSFNSSWDTLYSQFKGVYNITGFPDIQIMLLITPIAGFAHDFLEHTKNEHPRSLLNTNNNCSFEVDFKNTENNIKLMSYQEGLYLIEYRWTWNGRLWCTVTQFGYKSIDDNLNYKIMFEDRGKQFMHTVYSDSNARVSIPKSELDNIFRYPAAILASIEVLQKQPANGTEKKNVNAELLRHFECIVCMDYMIGPIYLCTNGHSICQPCRDQVTECPMCRSQIQTTRNYTLEGLASDFEFPCKFGKCLFVGKGNLFKKHQETCNYIEKVCPLKELYGCNKKFVYADLSEHIYKEHNKHWYKGDVISTFHKNEKGVFFLKYCSKLFRLNFYYQNELFTFVAKLMDSSEESSMYRFVVEILDTTENKNRLFCSKNLKAEKQEIQIHFASIRHLIHLELHFRMFFLEN